MVAHSQNGWPVVDEDHTAVWVIPNTGRHIVMHRGDAGFILAHYALWFHETIEKLDIGTWDEWGWAARNVRGSSDISNHASGTAEDLNATLHALGMRTTFKKVWQAARIKVRCRVRYRGLIRWGGSYLNRADEMHHELVDGSYSGVLNTKLHHLAYDLRRTKRGKRIIAANPHYHRTGPSF